MPKVYPNAEQLTALHKDRRCIAWKSIHKALYFLTGQHQLHFGDQLEKNHVESHPEFIGWYRFTEAGYQRYARAQR